MAARITQAEGYNLNVPTMLNINDCRVIIRLADQKPPHVHVFKGNGEAKTYLGDEAPRLAAIYGLMKPEV